MRRHFLVFFGCSIFKASIFSLLVEVESGDIIPFRFLHADPTCLRPGDPDAAVSGSCHYEGDPNPEIPACLEVELPPLCGEVNGQALQIGLRFCAQHAVYR